MKAKAKTSKPAPKKTVKKTVKPTVKKTAKPASKVSPKKAKPLPKLLSLIVQALGDKKAEDLRVLDVSQQSSLTDYLVLATGNSDPHLRALRIEVERVLDEQQAKILGVDTSKGSGWTVVDAFEIMVHLFTKENRGKYRMELLWKDATEVAL
jgi:ribosome-associated protein